MSSPEKRVAIVVGNGAYKQVRMCRRCPSMPIRWQGCCAMSASRSSKAQPCPRQDDGKAPRLPQEGRGRRRRAVLPCQPRHPHDGDVLVTTQQGGSERPPFIFCSCFSFIESFVFHRCNNRSVQKRRMRVASTSRFTVRNHNAGVDWC